MVEFSKRLGGTRCGKAMEATRGKFLKNPTNIPYFFTAYLLNSCYAFLNSGLRYSLKKIEKMENLKMFFVMKVYQK